MNILMKKQNKKIFFQIIFVLLQRCISVALRKLYSSDQLLGDALITTLQSKYRKFKQNYNNSLTKKP